MPLERRGARSPRQLASGALIALPPTEDGHPAEENKRKINSNNRSWLVILGGGGLSRDNGCPNALVLGRWQTRTLKINARGLLALPLDEAGSAQQGAQEDGLISD
jgi:hypothetical protein